MPAEQPIPESPVIVASPAERQKILFQFNEPVNPVLPLQVWEMLEPAFTRFAGCTALLIGEKTFSYAALYEKSNQVATAVAQQVKGANNSTIVLLLNRDEWMPACMLGILKTGAAYVPIDPAYPPSRIAFMFADAEPALVIADRAFASCIPAAFSGPVLFTEQLQAISLVTNTATPVSADLREAIAYLIYTSGSTGRPKGVQICQRNLICFLQWALREFAATPYAIAYAATSQCFDLSVFEIFLPLLQGKTIRLLPSALDIPRFLSIDEAVLLNTVPSVVCYLADEGTDWRRVTALNMAGEQAPRRLKADLPWREIEVRNLYGPSEDTTYSTLYRFAEGNDTVIPIGKPVSDTQLYIVNENGELLPEGVEGEIWLSGQCVAKGYRGNPALSAARFIPNPFLPGLTLYKTGDTGYWLPDGNVIFTGRMDDQVKLRGYRIELGEIQYQLEKHPAVEQAVVVIREVENEPQLVAYWKGQPDAAPALRAHLASALPQYMMPAYWFHLQQVPLNSNGKIDKKALPAVRAEQALPEFVPQPETSREPVLPPVPVTRSGETGPLSLFQEVVFHYGKNYRNAAVAFRMEGRAHIKELEKKWRELVIAHEILHTVFAGTGETRQQKILPPTERHFALNIFELTEPETENWLQEKTRTTFDTENGPLVSVHIAQLNGNYIVLLTAHPLVADVFTLRQLGKALLNEGEVQTPAFQYRDFAQWQKNLVSGAAGQQYRRFWKALQHSVPPLTVRPEGNMGGSSEIKNGRLVRALPLPLGQEIVRLANQSACTPFGIFVAAVNGWLRLHMHDENGLMGLALPQRPIPQTRQGCGMFTGVLPFTIKVPAAVPFIKLLKQVEAQLQEMAGNALLPVETAVEDRQNTRVLLAGYITGETECFIQTPAAGTQCAIAFVEANERFRLEIEYPANPGAAESIAQCGEQLEQVLMKITERPWRTAGNIVSGITANPLFVLQQPETAGQAAVFENEIQAKLAIIWQSLLNRSATGAQSHFFTLGGTEKLASDLLFRIAETWGVTIPLNSFLANPVIEYLSDYITAVRQSGHSTAGSEAAEDDLIL